MTRIWTPSVKSSQLRSGKGIKVSVPYKDKSHKILQNLKSSQYIYFNVKILVHALLIDE